jgi:hypothetical protein
MFKPCRFSRHAPSFFFLALSNSFRFCVTASWSAECEYDGHANATPPPRPEWSVHEARETVYMQFFGPNSVWNVSLPLELAADLDRAFLSPAYVSDPRKCSSRGRCSRWQDTSLATAAPYSSYCWSKSTCRLQYLQCTCLRKLE